MCIRDSCKAVIVNKNHAVDCARFVELTCTAIQPSRTAPRARFIPGSHDFPVDEGFPALLPYLCLLEIDQALTIAVLLSYQATTSNLRRRLRKGWGRKEKGEGIREGGKGTFSPFPFLAFLPLPCFVPATQFNLF